MFWWVIKPKATMVTIAVTIAHVNHSARCFFGIQLPCLSGTRQSLVAWHFADCDLVRPESGNLDDHLIGWRRPHLGG